MMRTTRTWRQAVAALRQDLRAKGTGAAIIVHQPACAMGHGEACDCRPRRMVVRPPHG